jgi:hypothetical protein
MADVEADEVLSLSALPDPCLLAVLKFCAANDQRSVLSAARAHSRLHQAAVLALRSIKADANRQEQVDSVLLYLGKHGQYVHSVSIEDERWHDPPLKLFVPTGLTVQLRSWQMKNILLVGKEFRRVLGPTLKQLQLKDCGMRTDGTADATVKALAAALSQLVSLEHLCLTGSRQCAGSERLKFPTAVLQQLQQLTYLEFEYVNLLRFDDGSRALQSLQAFTGLQDLRVKDVREGSIDYISITASMLSGAHHLTRLELAECDKVDPAALAGKIRLQHLQMTMCNLHAAETVQLMSQLQHLQQLTHLDLTGTLKLWVPQEDNPPAAAYAALVASSRLQHLNISKCRMPISAWHQHIFPPGRQLPQLRDLIMESFEHCTFKASDISPLVSCCIGLQSLDMRGVPYSAELLTQLQQLSRLHTLRLHARHSAKRELLQGVCQLTGLRELSMALITPSYKYHAQYAKVCDYPFTAEDLRVLLRLTQLQQLTALELEVNDHFRLENGPEVSLTSEVSNCST